MSELPYRHIINPASINAPVSFTKRNEIIQKSIPNPIEINAFGKINAAIMQQNKKVTKEFRNFGNQVIGFAAWLVQEPPLCRPYRAILHYVAPSGLTATGHMVIYANSLQNSRFISIFAEKLKEYDNNNV